MPVLEKLIDYKENIVGVITQPDRPQGRGRKILPSPIKKIALSRELSVFQPENINEEESIKKIKEFNPDLILVVAYGQILSKDILNIPWMGCVNIHASLLPKYRGASPINWTIINGEEESGITFIFMNEKVDAGDIIYQQKITIFPDETYGELNKRLSNVSAGIINKLLKEIKNGKIKRIPQEKQLATYTKKMSKEDGEIIWSNKGEKIYNLIRGTTPYPGAFTYYKGKKLKVTMARFLYNYQNELKLDFATAGEVVKIEKDGIFISTGDKGIIRILKVVPSGAKEMSAQQFVNGYKIKMGDILGK
ncbi:MAG: methionyl-tRNA formyltransferase [Candidatus Atribacteria bacterium]